MKHIWEPHTPIGWSPARVMMSEPRRKCANCGKVQIRETEYSWGRIVARRWVPLAGRCEKTTEQPQDQPGPTWVDPFR